MPVAIETTKRKFQQLLDGLTSPSPSSTTFPSTKRARLNPSSRVHALTKPRIAVPELPRDQVQISPWSQQAFLTRLSTYTTLTRWTPKPASINEVAWAKRGWECVQSPGVANTVVCKGHCEARLVVSLRPRLKDEDGKEIEGTEDASSDPSEELVERYERLIEEGHAESCIWRGENNACKNDIYRLMIARPSVWQPQLRKRYRSFERLGEKLPALHSLILPFDPKNVSQLLPTRFFQQQDEEGAVNPPSGTQEAEQVLEGEINRVALALALLGWCGTNESRKSPYAVAACDACFRRLGLWLYADKKSAHSTEATEGEIMKLDAIEEHRDYCPWINADTQCMTGALRGKAAWEVLQTLIQNDAARLSSTTTSLHSASRPTTPAGGAAAEPRQTEEEHLGADALTPGAASAKRREQVAEEDRRRFAKLRELSKSMGLKRWRLKQAREGTT